LSIYTDLVTALKADSTIYSATGDRIFQRQPLKEPSDTFINIIQESKTQQVANDDKVIRFFIFSKDMTELETLSVALISLLVDNASLGFKVALQTQSDAQVKLQNGFYYNTLTFIFKITT